MTKSMMGCILVCACTNMGTFGSIAVGATIHVPGDFPTIQQAIDAAANGDTIVVAPGTYDENLVMEFKAVNLTGSSGADSTTVAAADVQEPVLRLSVTDIGGPVTVDGFTFTGGAGGIGIDFAEVTIENCVIDDNLSASGIDLYWSDATLSNCTISSNGGSNVVGGGLRAFLSSVTLEGTAFSENRGLTGGAVYVTETIANFVDCQFMSNEGEDGGGLFLGFATVALTGCTFIKNVALNTGGAVFVADFTFGTDLFIDECSFNGNSAVEGGGILIESAQFVFVEIGNTAFCANQTGHITGDWTDVGGNTFEETCVFADLNGDGVVDGTDLDILLDSWGACPLVGGCPADLNGDGVVDVSDLLALLANWGPN